MTKRTGIGRIAKAVGGMRNLLAIAVVVVLVAIAVVQIATPARMLTPLQIFYVVFALVFVLYGMWPLYQSRRLSRYYWDRTKKHRLAVVGLGFIILLVLTAVFGPLLTSDPTAANFKEQNQPPVGFSMSKSVYDTSTSSLVTKSVQGDWKHPLGTDDKGRDMLAMLVSGARVSLQVGLMATFLAIVIGTLMGLFSAYLGGWADNLLMRLTDIMMTFPFFLLLVFIVFIYGPSLGFVILAIGLTGWTGVARLVRSDALSLRTREYVTAAKSLGVSDARIVLRHLVPNVISSIIVIATLSIPGVILAEAGLSFIGLGDPTVTSWGVILNAGQRSLETSWWIAVEPGILLFLTVLAFNFLGDGLRDAFDPRSQG
jgi:peptide/nickel transport system permease protein